MNHPAPSHHTSPNRSRVLALALAMWVIPVFVGGCDTDFGLRAGTLCRTEADCADGFVCRDRLCQCSSDAACEPGEFCNPSGSCQKQIGCTNSFQCPVGFICDLTSGNCIEQDKCTEDVQCPLGRICDPLRFQCVPGCRTVSDCELGDVCECPGETSCAVGTCNRGPCAGDAFCRLGEKCLDVDGEGTMRCVRDDRGPYCEACDNLPGTSSCPGDPRNFCLIDTSKPYGSFYCGVTCNDQADCPNGFSCNDVRILTDATCGGGRTCPFRGPESCETDSDCPGGECDQDAKRCRSVCVMREDGVQGGCTCMVDADCPQEKCEAGVCSISGRSCDPLQPDSCGSIYCVHIGEAHTGRTLGYCRIGRNCAPRTGITCDMVREDRR